ncbi:Histone deacetylase hda1 [Serendipita sp. 397]|nr:Histone deacetylase hda1 [Serendipita sp. 397]
MLESMEIDPPASTPSTSGIVQPRASLSKMTARRAMSNPLEKSEEKPRPRITGYVYDVTMMTHIHPTEDHPETPQRISVIYQEMYAQKLLKDASALFFRPVERQQALLVHSEDHWNKVERMAC